MVIFCVLTVLLLVCGGALLPASSLFMVAEARALSPSVEDMASNAISAVLSPAAASLAEEETLLCSQDNRSFWLRNSCYGGFVTVLQQRRAVAQHGGGLGQHSKEGEHRGKSPSAPHHISCHPD